MNQLNWTEATGMPGHDNATDAPMCALVPNPVQECDQVAIVYDKHQGPPEITVNKVSGFVQTVLANGIAVAVIASASAPLLTPDDVLLVERAF